MDESAVNVSVTSQQLAHCEDEPIRIPGSIQQHGFLLAVATDSDRVLFASENAEAYLGVPLRLIFNAPLTNVLPREAVQAFLCYTPTEAETPLAHYLGSFLIRGELFSLVTHRVGHLRVLELERQETLVNAEMMNSVVTNFVSALSKVKATDELCNSIVRQVAELTGFDRVMLYSFDESGAGTVLAEANNGNLPSYLGLRFPGSDIPQQARALYLLNTSRIIPDADYAPSPLAGLNTKEARQLDLSLSTLRSVSPVHLQYMRNMGTLSSMSLSIVCEGKLWGLISGHHATPHRVPYLVRGACDMLAKLTATQIISFQTSERLDRTVMLHAVQRTLLTQIAAEKNHLFPLTDQLTMVRQVTGAAGAALVLDGAVWKEGIAPDDASLIRLCAWLEETAKSPITVTHHLSSQADWASDMHATASGLIAARISDVKSRWLLWFRPEAIQTVQWAGDPSTAENDTKSLTPRTSFNIWKETVRETAVPWSEAEVQSATDFRAALQTIGLQRAEEEAELQEARFQQLAQALPVKIFTCDGEGNLIYTNTRWQDRGLPTQGPWFQAERLHPEDRERTREAWQSAMQSGQDFQEEIRLFPNDGPYRWYFIHAVPFRRRGDVEASGWVASCTDLTERREREAALQMAEKLALTGRMTSVIAHEINNPLESITNLMYLLRGEVPASGVAQNYVSMAESELIRISAITKQTLRWNRENSGSKAWHDAQTTICDVLQLFHGKITNRHVQMHVQVQPGSRYCGVEGQIRQVIANLISNAIDAVAVGGSIWITIEESEEITRIHIKDNGKGMDPETLAQLFRPFFSTKGDLGNGLGLYISHEIVERHNGTLTVESTVGQGTTFTMALPANSHPVPHPTGNL